MIIQLQIEDSQSQFFIDLISKLKGVVEEVNVIKNGELTIDSEEQHFLASAYNSVVEDNKKEDQIWMKYQEGNGFCKNVLTGESEDVWNDV